MTTLGESLNGASKAALKAVADSVAESAEENPEALPELENGQAVPPKPKRKYTKRAAKWGNNAAPEKPAAEAPSISIKFQPPEGKRVKLNLADTVGEEVVMGAARFPIFAADMVGTIATKGRFQLMDNVNPAALERVDRTFKEGVLGDLVIECTPLQAWLLTCAGVVGSALALAGLTYTFALKEKAGKVPPGAADAVRDLARSAGNGSGGNGVPGGFQAPPSQGMEAIQQ